MQRFMKINGWKNYYDASYILYIFPFWFGVSAGQLQSEGGKYWVGGLILGQFGSMALDGTASAVVTAVRDVFCYR